MLSTILKRIAYYIYYDKRNMFEFSIDFINPKVYISNILFMEYVHKYLHIIVQNYVSNNLASIFTHIKKSVQYIKY